MSTIENLETFAPSPPGTHPPLDSPEYRSTHLRHPKLDPLVLDPAKLDRSELGGPIFGEGTVDRRRRRPDRRSERRSRRAADHRHWTAARRRRPTDRRLARRAVAGQRLGPLPPRLGQLAGHARSQLHGRGPLSHRRRRCLSLHDDSPRRLPVGQPPQRLAPGASPLQPVRSLLHPAARHPDVLSRRPVVLPGSDLQLGARAVASRPRRRLRPRHDDRRVGARVPLRHGPAWPVPDAVRGAG